MKRQAMRRIALGLLTLTLAVLACNLSAAPESQNVGEEAVSVAVSTEGAEISGPGGLRLIVREGALESEEEIQVE